MNASSLPLSTAPRSGPIVPLAPASASVWQDAQLASEEVKTALPAAAVAGAPPPPPPPPGDCAGCPSAFSHAANFSGVSTVAVERMTACPRPQSSAQTIG